MSHFILFLPGCMAYSSPSSLVEAFRRPRQLLSRNPSRSPSRQPKRPQLRPPPRRTMTSLVRRMTPFSEPPPQRRPPSLPRPPLPRPRASLSSVTTTTTIPSLEATLARRRRAPPAPSPGLDPPRRPPPPPPQRRAIPCWTMTQTWPGSAEASPPPLRPPLPPSARRGLPQLRRRKSQQPFPTRCWTTMTSSSEEKKRSSFFLVWSLLDKTECSLLSLLWLSDIGGFPRLLSPTLCPGQALCFPLGLHSRLDSLLCIFVWKKACILFSSSLLRIEHHQRKERKGKERKEKERKGKTQRIPTRMKKRCEKDETGDDLGAKVLKYSLPVP